MAYIILELKLIQCKCITFVNDVDRCYRYHVVQEFNKWVYDDIIATDEGGSEQGDENNRDFGDGSQQIEEEDCASLKIITCFPSLFCSLTLGVCFSQRDPDADNVPGPSQRKCKLAPTPPAKTGRHKKRQGVKCDKEYGVARGIDFLDVACVLNFDLSSSARAGRGETALSFVLPSSEFGKHKAVGSVPSTQRDEKTWSVLHERSRAACASTSLIRSRLMGFGTGWKMRCVQ